MPAPDRDPPFNISQLAFNPVKGIVGHYSAVEVDTLLTGVTAGDVDLAGYATLTDLNDALANIPEAAITVHDGSIPNPAEETPKGLEDSFAAYSDGLHYFKEPGTLVAITRQQYQTDITLTGPVSSSAKIVKSEAGLPTPQNPSMIVLKRADGQWIKMTSDELDKPFGQPQMVNLFALTGGGAVDLSPYYTKAEVDAAFPNYQYLSEITDSLNSSASFYVSNASAQLDEKIQLKADKADTYTKTEIDTAFSENSQEHQEIESLVRELGVLFGGRLDLKADVATTYTKPEVDEAIAASISGQLSPEQITDIISQVGPVDLTDYAKLDDYSQDITAHKVNAQAFKFTKADTTLGYARFPDYPEGKLGIEIGGPGGKVETIAYESSLANYATKKSVDLLSGAVDAVIGGNYTKEESDAKFAKQTDNTQNIVANAVVAQGYTFGDAVSGSNPGLVYTDTGEGYGPRLVLGTPTGHELIPYQSDFEPIKARLTTLESKGAPPVIDAYSKTECDCKFLTLVDVDRFAYQADVYTQKQIDDKLIAINPIGAPTINNPALAEFKQSVLDEVKKLIAGGKTVPADIDWTVCPSVAGSGTIEARLLNGMLQLRGEVTITISATGSFTQVRKLPANFPKPLAEFNSLVYGIMTAAPRP